MSEALAFHLEGLLDDGEAIPQPHTTSVDFTDEDFQGVEYIVVEHIEVAVPQMAAHHGVSAA